jgi:hypothetical protein
MTMQTGKTAFRMLLLSTLLLLGCNGNRGMQAEPASHVKAASPVSPAAAPAASASSRPSGAIRFTDVTAQAGIHFQYNNGAFGKKYLPETMGPGVCILDYNHDGLQDIFLVNSTHWPGHGSGHSYSALYRNNGDGTFTDVTRPAGLAIDMYGMGCAVGDYDNDGYDDLYVTGVGRSHLFRNKGNGTFEDVTDQAGVASPGFATSAAWVDYDKDGELDLFVGHYVKWSPATDQYCSLTGKSKSYCTPEAYQGESSELFHNLGNGRFENVTKRSGLVNPAGKALGVALLDFDGDGWMDLFVANDTQPNNLYRNNHDGTFTDAGLMAGVAYGDAGQTRAGMGTDSGDYDNSGRQSLVIGNFANQGLALYRNDGGGLFTNRAPRSGLARMTMQSLTFATMFLDYDLDGRLDILAVNGHVADDIHLVQPNIKYAEPAQLFRNDGRNKFEEVTSSVGSALETPIVGRGAAYLDYDNDGDLDLVIMDNQGNARLLRNDNANQNSMLRVRLIGTRSNRDGIGAGVTVTSPDGRHQFGMVKSGSSYLSQSELPLTFGLGKPEPNTHLTLKIAWPSGHVDTIPNVEPDQSLTIEEGRGVVARHAFFPKR